MTKTLTKTKIKFDILEFLKNRPLSWSSISSFEYSPEDWFNKYYLNIKDPENAEMRFGKKVALSIEKGTCKVPGLLAALQKKKEHRFSVTFGKIPLIGFADAFCDEHFKTLDEVKTGVKPWDQKRVDNHGQLDMYCLMNFITNKVKPEEVKIGLYWIPTRKVEQENGDFSNGDYRIEFADPVRFIPFQTKRTMQDILAFGARINRTVKAMEDYVNSRI